MSRRRNNEESEETPKRTLRSTCKDRAMDEKKIGEMFEEMKAEAEKERMERRKEREERKKDMEMIMGTLEGWKEEKEVLKKKISDLEARVEMIDRQGKKKNIVLENIESDNKGVKLVEEVNELLNRVQGLEIKVTDARSVFFQAKDKGKKQLIVATLENFDQKIELMKKKREVVTKKGGKTVPVYINDDLTAKEREISYKARNVRNNLKDKGKKAEIRYARGKPYIRIEDEKDWIWNEEAGDFEEEK